MLRYPIWIRDASDPDTDVGIEIPFDIVVDIEYETDSDFIFTSKARFTGKLDGLHWNKDDLIIIEGRAIIGGLYCAIRGEKTIIRCWLGYRSEG